MTTPSAFQSLGLSLAYSDPLWKADRSALLGNLSGEVSSYNHEVKAMGGYWSSSLGLKGRQTLVEEWFSEGLGRHIETYNPALEKIFEGFVNHVSLSIGGLSVERGDLLAIGNRVFVVYSTVNTATTPPTVGIRAVTALNNDTVSQEMYGIIQKSLSTGGATAAGAEQIRDTYLRENRWAETGQSLSLGGNRQELSASITVAGYVRWLEAYTYGETVSGEWSIREKILDILADDPNGLISRSYGDIAENTFNVPRYEADNPTAWAAIKELVAIGDTSDRRYTFGVYNGRRASYGPIPETVEYQHRLGDKAQRVETPIGGLVRNWDVKPARWLFIPDFLVGRSQPADFRLDPRYMFIESARFSLPNNLELKGGKTDSLPQKLAKLGLSGVGA